MELQDLKQKWNMLDERLSKSEVYNKRTLEEIIKGNNKTTYEKLQKQGMFNFFVTLFIAAAIYPLLYSKGIFHDISFYILEAVCLLGIVMVTCRLAVLSRLNVMKTPAEQLCNITNYKRCYFFESVIGVSVPRFTLNIPLRHSDCSLSVSVYSPVQHVPTWAGRNIRIRCRR